MTRSEAIEWFQSRTTTVKPSCGYQDDGFERYLVWKGHSGDEDPFSEYPPYGIEFRDALEDLILQGVPADPRLEGWQEAAEAYFGKIPG